MYARRPSLSRVHPPHPPHPPPPGHAVDDRSQEEPPMATFVLIPGAGSTAWYWHLVEPELRVRGHDVIAVTLPVDDDAAGLAEYTDAVIAAIEEQAPGADDLVLV